MLGSMKGLSNPALQEGKGKGGNSNVYGPVVVVKKRLFPAGKSFYKVNFL